MKKQSTQMLATGITVMLLFLSCKKFDHRGCGPDDRTVTTSKVFASGLNNPRGLKFGPNGYLYVAEAGTGGTHFYSKCTQVIPPVGPYKGSSTGSRIVAIDRNGNLTTVADHLPSSTTTEITGSGNQGVADVEFIGNTLYGLLSGAGCSHAVPGVSNGVFKVNSNKTWTLVADYSSFLMSHPVAHPEIDDFEPDGTAYSMIRVGQNLYIIEPNHGEMDVVMPDKSIHRVIDFSAKLGHVVPTCITYHRGNFYVGNLQTFPIVQGKSSIYKVTPEGELSTFATGFTTVLGVAFDSHDQLYVLENTVGSPSLAPGKGDVVRVDRFGKREVVADGLNFPTAMTFGPDGKLYVSVWGIGPAGLGQVMQLSFKCEEVHASLE
jgi:hypothetical protein